MDPLTIGLVIAALREGVIGVVKIIEVFRKDGKLDAEAAKELLAAIKAEGELSDQGWDAAVDAAKARLDNPS